MRELSKRDPEIASLIRKEEKRQRHKLVFIASENYVSRAVLEAQATVLTNKYAEGYPGHRYYGGCQEIDDVEEAAIARARQLFQAEYANVQPHSGTQAASSTSTRRRVRTVRRRRPGRAKPAKSCSPTEP